MTMRTKWLWIGVAALALSNLALAQQSERPRRQGQPDFGFGGRMMGRNVGMMLLTREDVQKELNLSQTQKAKLEQLRQEMQQAMQQLRDLPPEQRRERMQELRQKYDPDTILNETQRKRLRELELQWQGPFALNDPEVAKQVGLTEEQRAKIRGIIQEAFQSVRGQPGQPGERMQEFQKAREQAEKKILEVLTPAQREKWQQMLGKPFEFQGGRGFGPGGFGRPRGGGGFGGRRGFNP
jgi:Spy/CpxP family protein refolding chaperone